MVSDGQWYLGINLFIFKVQLYLQVFDKDNNGLITLDEFYDTFKNNGYDVDKEELSIIVENVRYIAFH